MPARRVGAVAGQGAGGAVQQRSSAVVSGQRSAVSGQRSAVSGQRSAVSGQRRVAVQWRRSERGRCSRGWAQQAQRAVGGGAVRGGGRRCGGRGKRCVHVALLVPPSQGRGELACRAQSCKGTKGRRDKETKGQRNKGTKGAHASALPWRAGAPLPNMPRSPPCAKEPQSERSWHLSWKFSTVSCGSGVRTRWVASRGERQVAARQGSGAGVSASLVLTVGMMASSSAMAAKERNGRRVR
jgi:hypothetical protein